MLLADNFFWTHHNRLNESIKRTFLFEENHRVMIFKDAIFDIAQQVDYNLKTYKHENLIYSGWSFYPNDGRDAKCQLVDNFQPTVSPKEKGFFPIYIRLKEEEFVDEPLAVEDRRFEPERIVIFINVSYFKNNSFNINWVKNKLRHELTHARTLYAKFDLPLHLAKKYQTVDIDYDFIAKSNNLNQRVYFIVSDVLYMFSPTELDARLNETVQAVSQMTSSELGIPPTYGSSMAEFISKIISKTDEFNGVSYMQKLVDEAKTVYNDSALLAYAVVGFHLKNTQRHKDSSLTDAFLRKCFANIAFISREDKDKLFDIVYNVADTLEKLLWNFEKRIYDASLQ